VPIDRAPDLPRPPPIVQMNKIIHPPVGAD